MGATPTIGSTCAAHPEYLLEWGVLRTDPAEPWNRASATTFVPRTNLPAYIDFRQFLHDMRERVSQT